MRGHGTMNSEHHIENVLESTGFLVSRLVTIPELSNPYNAIFTPHIYKVCNTPWQASYDVII